MQQRKPLLAAGAAAMLGVALSAPAHALVTFESTLSGVECGITSAAATVFGDCDTPSFYDTVTAGQTAFVRATLNYHYTDDGLALPHPTAVQGDKFGFDMIPVTHEAGALYVSRTDCYRQCPFPGNVDVEGTPFAPLMLGFNDVPDDLTGSLPMFVQMSYPAGDVGGWSMQLSVSAWLLPVSVSVPAPIPEPATWSLLGAGLLAGTFMRWRRAPA